MINIRYLSVFLKKKYKFFLKKKYAFLKKKINPNFCKIFAKLNF